MIAVLLILIVIIVGAIVAKTISQDGYGTRTPPADPYRDDRDTPLPRI